MSVSCFYDGYALEDMTSYLKELIKVKIAFDIHGYLPSDIVWNDSLITEFILQDVTCLDKQKMFNFDGIPEELTQKLYDPDLMLRISIPNIDWDKEEMLKETIKQLFMISPDLSDGEYLCVEHQNDLIVIADGVYLETFLFFVALKGLRESLLQRERSQSNG